MSNDKYNYGYGLNDEIVQQGEDSHCKLLRMVSPGSVVLECGPAYGMMTKYLKENLHCEVHIIEYDKESFNNAIKYADSGVCADIENDDWLEQFNEQYFDYIIYADILEHLRKPEAVLIKMRRFLKPDGSVLLSVPNVAHGDIIMNLLGDRFNYTPLGLLDSTHIHLFARQNLWIMVKNTGYFIAEEDCVRQKLFSTEQGENLSLEFAENVKRFFENYPTKDVYQYIYRITLKKSDIKSEIGIIEKDRQSIFEPVLPVINSDFKKNFFGKIYFDCGQGLTEKNSVQIIINDNNRIKHKINLPENCQSVRFDPVEGYGCLIWNLQVRTESQFLQVIDHNGQVLNDVYVFRTTDSQIYLENLPAGSRWLEIEAEIVCFEQAAWTKLVQEIENAKQEMAELLAEKEIVVEEHLLAMQQAESNKQSMIQTYEQKIVENQQQYEQKIADNLQAYEQSIQEQYNNFVADKQVAEESFKQKIAGQNQLLNNVQQQAIKQQNKLQQELDEICAQKNSVQQELAHYKEHYAAAIGQRNDLQSQLAAAQNAYNVISNAFFWKITKPARLFMDCVKYPFKKSRTIHFVIKGLRCLKENGFGYTWNKVQQKLKHQQDYSKAALSVYSDADLVQQRQTKFDRNIKFSILTPLYNTPEKFLCEMIQSVIDQTYGNWELCLADGSDEQHKYVGKICHQYAKKDNRVKYKKLNQNLGISANTNACIEMSVGDYIGLLDHDDLLHPAALYENMRAICEQNADFIYTDENTFHFKPEDSFCPHFKPDFAPDTLRSYNYICHFTVFQKELLAKAGGGFRSEFDGSQDYDLVLRLTEQAINIVHIPIILYYWRAHQSSVASDVSAKPYTLTAAKRALAEHLQRLGLIGEVQDSRIPSTYHIEYKLIGNPLISILIPNNDHVEDLRKCIQSIQFSSTYQNWEIIVIENNSKNAETFDYYQDMQEDKRIKVVVWQDKFNYSAINNFGAEYANGDYLLLLNNDIEVITPDWLEQMLMFAQRQEVGAVGSMLYYPDDTVQHGGVILGIGGVGGHAHKHFKRGDYGYMSRLAIAQNLSAVTAACMLIRRQVWDSINGLDENFEVAFNDVDLCMRIRKSGYLIVWTPYAELYHYESKSRGYEDTPKKQKRFHGEVLRFKKRWAKELAAGDPYYNPNFTLEREDFSLR